jgi:hypothetical protein
LDATTVIATGSGELEKTNKVKKIFHAPQLVEKLVRATGR